MSRILQQLQSQSQGFNQAAFMERGNKQIAQGEAHAQYLQEVAKQQAFKQGKNLIQQQFGETALQSAEMIAPALLKGGKALAKSTGIDKYLEQKKQNAKEWTESQRGKISNFIDDQTPQFVKNLTQKRATDQKAGSVPSEDSSSSVDPTTDKFINDATYASIRSRVDALTPEGQKAFEVGMLEMNKGIPHPINFETGEIDPEKLSKTADLYAETFNRYGSSKLVGGGGGFANMMREKLGRDPIPQGGGAKISEPYQVPEETIAKLYRDAGATPELNVGETASQYQSRVARGGSIRGATLPPQIAEELENPRDPPQQEYRGEIDPDKRPGGIVSRGYQTLSIPTEDEHLAALGKTRPAPAIPAESVTQPVKIAESFPVPGGQKLEPGYSLLADATATGRGKLFQKPKKTKVADPVGEQQLQSKRFADEKSVPSYGQVGNPLRGPDAPPPPPRPTVPQKPIGYQGTPTAQPNIKQPEEDIQPIAPRQAERDYSLERGGGANDPREEDTPKSGAEQPVEQPKEGGGEGFLGGYGLEAGFGIAALGETLNPQSSSTDKIKQLAVTGAGYLGTKVAAKGLEAAGMGAGLGEIMTGVETVQDLTDKHLSGTQKAEAVGKTVGTYAGATALEAAVPGLGELAMVGTGLYELFHGIHKEKEQKAAQPAPPSNPTMPQAHIINSVSFDSAPVIDSSSYHSL